MEEREKFFSLFKPEKYLSLDLQSGSVFTQQKRLIILAPEILFSGIANLSRPDNKEKREIVVEMGRLWGKERFAFLEKILEDNGISQKLKDLEIDLFLQLFNFSVAFVGLGRFAIELYGDLMFFRLYDSICLLEEGASRLSGSFLSGFLSGFLSNISQKPVACVEIICGKDKKGEPCQFLIGESKITEKSKELIKKGVSKSQLQRELFR
jgi:predicted hydrocarbon binding protein